MHTDFYALLGVQRTATADEIKAAYRRLAQRLHPDVAADAGSEERFKEITRAYQTLRDPDQRVRYELEEMERALELAEQEFNNAPRRGSSPRRPAARRAPSPSLRRPRRPTARKRACAASFSASRASAQPRTGRRCLARPTR